MPYLCRVSISGPEPDDDGVTAILDAVSAAVQAGWDAPRVITGDEDDDHPDSEHEHSDGEVLDYRVLGYPGGAIILVVLGGSDLMQTSIAVAGLAGHLTTWSPALLEYSPDEVKISKIDKPYDDENWLPPIKEENDDDESERPRWHLAELLDDGLQELAAYYLLARAIQSLWNPADTRHWAWEVVAGAVEDPWGRELSSALGVLLIRAARLESGLGSTARLIVQGPGTPDLAADLLARARETGSESETDGWTDDEMRGYALMERFMKDHQLQWNRVLDSESAAETDTRSNRQLKALLWAGLQATATMAVPLAHLSGPWQVLDELGTGGLVTILAEEEEGADEEGAHEDEAELASAGAAYALVWLAVRQPQLLDGPGSGVLIQQVAENETSFHQVLYSTWLMVGSGPMRAAIEARQTPAQIRLRINDYLAALEAVESDDDESTDFRDEMHSALEDILLEGPEFDERVRYLLKVTGRAAELTATDVNPHRGEDRYVSTPRMLTHYLLAEPALLAAVILHCDDEDAAIRARMLALTAQVAARAAAELAAEFPDLDGADPRLEPAARARAVRWVQTAMRVADEEDQDVGVPTGADAKTILAAITAGARSLDEWPIQRFVAAAAEAASSILDAADATEYAPRVFDAS